MDTEEYSRGMTYKINETYGVTQDVTQAVTQGTKVKVLTQENVISEEMKKV